MLGHDMHPSTNMSCFNMVQSGATRALGFVMKDRDLIFVLRVSKTQCSLIRFQRNSGLVIKRLVPLAAFEAVQLGDVTWLQHC